MRDRRRSKQRSDMAYYNDVMSKDIVSMAYGLLEKRALKLRDVDGKLVYDSSTEWKTPWHHVKSGDSINCQLWNAVMFVHLFKNLPYSVTGGRSFIPTGCQHCFKVVVRPPTLKALFALEALQERLGLDSKCGIEMRAHVFGLYGGYFYNRGLSAGHECYGKVRAAVDADPELGPGVSVILKRACTEMEQECGPSDKWEIYPNQIEIEQLINRKVSTDLMLRQQPDIVIDHVHGKWIRFAYQWGDETVFDYIDPEMPLYPPYVTYHDKGATP